jgi:molybdopterin-guanine dinucleotide biosynthesis protein A
MEIKALISGFILAGGMSSRMGSDKALLLVKGEPLLGRMIRLVEPFCQTVAVSGEKQGYMDFNIEMVPDLLPGCGPIGGVISSLKHSSTEWNLLISVDVPFVNPEFLHHLISCLGEYDCIVPQHEGRVEPLMGLYHRQIIPVVEEMIDRGDYKLMRLLDKLNVRYVNCDPLVKEFPRLFSNINFPEDYHSCKAF